MCKRLTLFLENDLLKLGSPLGRASKPWLLLVGLCDRDCSVQNNYGDVPSCGSWNQWQNPPRPLTLCAGWA